MAFETSERVEDGVFVFACRGRFDPTSMVSAFQVALASAMERGETRLLFDCRGVTGVPTTLQRFEMGTQAADLYRSQDPTKKLTVAMLVTSEVLDPNRFGQTVARNRGLMGVITDDQVEAMEFLKAGS